MNETLRRDNAKHVATINKAWGHKVAWLEPEPGFEIKSTLVGGMDLTLLHSNWVPPFVTLKDVRNDRE